MLPTAIVCAAYKHMCFVYCCYIHIGKGHTMPCLCRHRENMEI